MRRTFVACVLLVFAASRAGAQEWLPLGYDSEWHYDSSNEYQSSQTARVGGSASHAR